MLNLNGIACAAIIVNLLYLTAPANSDGNTSVPELTIKPNTQWCLNCVCQAISNCNASKSYCEGDVCGVFRITWAYWADGGKNVLPGDDVAAPGAYANCTNDIKCAGLTVSSYFQRYAQDCNGDGHIDCLDYGAIHLYGGYGCAKPQTGDYFDKLRACIKRAQEVKTGIDVRSGIPEQTV